MLYASKQTNKLISPQQIPASYTTCLLVAHHRIGGIGEAHALHQGLHDVVLLLEGKRPGEAEAGGPAMYIYAVGVCLIERVLDSENGRAPGNTLIDIDPLT